MDIDVHRITSDDDSTLSVIYIDGVFECFGLEDEYRENKVPADTRIPAGEYRVELRTEGGFHNRYTSKFPAFHEGMLHVQDVPGFEYILIHIGNTDENTEGCLLVGQNGNTAGELTVGSSTNAYKSFYKKVIEACKNNDLNIIYQDFDR